MAACLSTPRMAIGVRAQTAPVRVVRRSLRVCAAADTEAKPEAEVKTPQQTASPPAAAAASTKPGAVVRPHRPRATSASADPLEVLAFNGTAPELINGRLAMLGFVAAVGCEIFTGTPVMSQWGAAFGTVSKIFLLFMAGSLVPLFRGYNNDEAFGPFTPEAERLNGRAAMIGFASLIVIEAFKGAALF